MESVKILLLIFTLLQASPPPAPVRGDRFQIAVPQGWKVLNSGDDVILRLLERYAPLWLAGLLGAGIMAAVMEVVAIME